MIVFLFHAHGRHTLSPAAPGSPFAPGSPGEPSLPSSPLGPGIPGEPASPCEMTEIMTELQALFFFIDTWNSQCCNVFRSSLSPRRALGFSSRN